MSTHKPTSQFQIAHMNPASKNTDLAGNAKRRVVSSSQSLKQQQLKAGPKGTSQAQTIDNELIMMR